jgi:hypothetical protein
VNDSNLYTGVEGVIKPILGQVYVVRGFTDLNGFYLEGINNMIFNWYSTQGKLESIAEPGFANWRFEPAQPARKNKIVNIEILPIVEERIGMEETVTETK